VIAIDTSAAGLTVRMTEEDRAFRVTPIVVMPRLLLVARPCLPAELLIVATAALLEVQCPVLVTFCVVPSE
jgi:hypothetical protein